MSIRDVRDIIGVAGHSAPAAKKAKLSHDRRTDGMNRELYNLLGDSRPPVVTIQSKFKEKPKFKHVATKWAKTPFVNRVRKDELVLHHWTKELPNEAGPRPNTFDNFDLHPEVVSYTEEEYLALLDKVDWSRAETDALIDLCRVYDLRFVVIHDRWAGSSMTPRTMEQLKDRYYFVCRSVLASRGQSTEGLDYDCQRETTRKQYLEDLSKRTPQEIEEENMLIVESKRLETYEKTLAQQKADLLRLLETPAAQGSYAQYTTSQGLGTLAQGFLASDKQKHKKRPSEAPSPAVHVRQKHRKLSPREEREHGVSWHDKLSSGAFLRSQKTIVLKQAVAAKVQSVMTELGMSNVLTMPTEKTVKKFDALQQKIGILLEAKRVCDKCSEQTDSLPG